MILAHAANPDGSNFRKGQAFIDCLANVINDHCSDGFAAVRLLQQVAGERGCRDFRNVLMLADRSDFVLSRCNLPMKSCLSPFD
jgi:hypothetical protein